METTVALPIIQEQEQEIEPVEPVEVTKETVMESTITTKEDIQPQTETQPSTQLEPEVSKENIQTDNNQSAKQSQEPAETSMLILFWLLIKGVLITTLQSWTLGKWTTHVFIIHINETINSDWLGRRLADPTVLE